MRGVIYIGSFNAGATFLIRGEENIIVDPGMAWCAERAIRDIEDIIGSGRVGAMLLTHSHYDHVAAVPVFKRMWPEAPVYAGERALQVLKKPRAREMMLRLSMEAARENDARLPEDYDISELKADRAVKEGEELRFGDTCVKAYMTPGHTRDCVSYLVDGEILMSSESMGFVNCDDSYNPQYLVSYRDAYESLIKSRNLGPRRLCIPHNGILEEPGEEFWEFFLKGIEESREFMLEVLRSYPDEESRLRVMEKKYWHPERFGGWPREAYDVNALAMLGTLEREFPEEAKA